MGSYNSEVSTPESTHIEVMMLMAVKYPNGAISFVLANSLECMIRDNMQAHPKTNRPITEWIVRRP
jgi:hypothetical protein